MKTRPLTPAMTHALLSLRAGHPFGIDRRTENALWQRGLAFFHKWKSAGGIEWETLKLSHEGRMVADGLHLQSLVAAGAVTVRHGLAVIDGGKPDVIGRSTMLLTAQGGFEA